MAGFRPAEGDQAQFRSDLLGAGLLIDSGVPGIYGRSAAFEAIRAGFARLVTRVAGPDDAEELRFPPVLPRAHLETSGYLASFPHLAGTVFAFEGSEAQAHEQSETAARHADWSAFQTMSDVVLTPAACYPVYPMLAARGALAPGGATFDLGGSYVYRHEPACDPARMQMFHQHEMVRAGDPGRVAQWRDTWRERAVTLLRGLGLDARADIASDPFFGRSGRMLGASQRAQELKFEVVVPIAGPEPTAVASFNYHQEHFASAFGIESADGHPVHTACLGFGHERVTLALLRAHGLDIERWPAEVRAELFS